MQNWPSALRSTPFNLFGLCHTAIPSPLFEPLSQSLSGRQRARLLRQWHELAVKHSSDLSLLITLENGKSLADSKGEVTYAAGFIEWVSEEAPRIYGHVLPLTAAGNQVISVKEPIGVCVLITPQMEFPCGHGYKVRLPPAWLHHPFVLRMTRKVGAALAAGCTVVIKSPEETPFTVNALVELARKAGIPPGVINVVTAKQNTEEVGLTLTTSASVHKVSFSGSTRVGKLLMRHCAEGTLKKISLELGGNAPFIVFDDADIDNAINAALVCKFRCTGQTCIAANNIYVQNRIYDEFASKLAERVRNEFIIGNGLNTNVAHGPLLHSRAVDKVQAQVDDALGKSGRVLVGGNKMSELGPNFFEPTVITDLTTAMQLAKEETFRPIATLFRFSTENEVIKLANGTDMGLSAYIFSQDFQRVWRTSTGLDAGMVGVNIGSISDPSSPFGGIKSSGFGREGSKYGIDKYVVVKAIVLSGLGMSP
ncbi:hypothetical protein NPX13_g10513 [Xylaria arbuscula]|uniref:Succinate-semialdehyde dehydrogenase, mitochondrial n=1 Tax=Xylaria arbuscula TaxID=114810 RepID=A0A9W8N4J8_9PEZI|nr:hypothetical protein NPX13_g10513 [Xylaria arbuscula]